MARIKDMTKGNPTKLMLTFSLPLMLTNIGQQLYMIADGAIVGRGVGVLGLASVGATDWVYWLILWTVLAATQGYSTFVSRYFGQKNFEKMNTVLAQGIILTCLTALFLTAAGLILTEPVLKLLDTPADILDGAKTYLYIMVSGTLVVSAFNMSASVLRALGDGKTPLIAMVISGVLNVALDLLFILVFKMGIAGAAFATLIAQLTSFIYCFIRLKKTECISLKRSDFKPDLEMMKELLGFSMPLALQHIVIAVSGIILQSVINLEGSIFLAGYTATNKLYGLLESTSISLSFAFTTYFSQNFGAGLKDRLKEGMRSAVIISVVAAIVVFLLVIPFGKNLLTLFINTAEAGADQALAVAYRYLVYMAFFLIVLYLIYVYRSFLQALGNSFWSMISGLGEFSVRAVMSKVFVPLLGLEIFYWIEPMAWVAAGMFVFIPYFCLKDKLINSAPI